MAYSFNRKLKLLLESQNPRKAIQEFAKLRKNSCVSDSYTFLFLIKACSSISVCSDFEGKQVHGQIVKLGFTTEVINQTALINMYAGFGDLSSAQKVLDESPQKDVVQWNSLISAYARNGDSHKAILTVKKMVNESVKPNVKTLSSIAVVCSQMKWLALGRSVHAYAVRNVVNFDTIMYNALIKMYAKCSRVQYAFRVFTRMESWKNVVSWTSMINAYCDNGRPHEASVLFRQMVAEGIPPDEVAVLSLIVIRGRLGNSEFGFWIDQYVEEHELPLSTQMANALIDMYAKCGNIKKSCCVFNQMPNRTLVSWSVMIQALALHGHGVAALVRFSQMLRDGFKPDEIMFLNVLSACCHTGLVNEGRKCFKSLVTEHGLTPSIEHYGIMVDLLCRAGHVTEAFELVLSMDMKPDGIIWRTLIAACQEQGNIELARKITSRLIETEPENCENYILQSKLHAVIGEWKFAEQVRYQMCSKFLKKSTPGTSLLIEANTS